MSGLVLAAAVRLARQAIEAFVEDEALTQGAAIAFYAVTAIVPVLYIVVTIASFGFGPEAAQDAIAIHLRRLMSRESAQVVQLAIRNARGNSNGFFSSAIGLCALIGTASGVFGAMEGALNKVWRVPTRGFALRGILRERAASLALVIGLGFLLLVSMVLTAAVTALGRYIDEHTPFSSVALGIFNLLISGVLMSLFFAAIYKVLPNKSLEWRDVGVGAIATALLFLFGQMLIGYYLGTTGLSTSYAAAGSLILLLLWVYYSAQVFLLGAEFTKVYACNFGSQRAESCGSGPS
jgi:membrane protein